MISYIRGELASLEREKAIVDVGSGLWEYCMKTIPELCAKEASPCSYVISQRVKELRWNRV